jgi:hypothetical protein
MVYRSMTVTVECYHCGRRSSDAEADGFRTDATHSVFVCRHCASGAVDYNREQRLRAVAEDVAKDAILAACDDIRTYFYSQGVGVAVPTVPQLVKQLGDTYYILTDAILAALGGNHGN